MPPQSPPRGRVAAVVAVPPPTVSSLYEVKMTLVVVGPAERLERAALVLDEQRGVLELEGRPGSKTSVVSNGTDALPLVDDWRLEGSARLMRAR